MPSQGVAHGTFNEWPHSQYYSISDCLPSPSALQGRWTASSAPEWLVWLVISPCSGAMFRRLWVTKLSQAECRLSVTKLYHRRRRREWKSHLPSLNSNTFRSVSSLKIAPMPIQAGKPFCYYEMILKHSDRMLDYLRFWLMDNTSPTIPPTFLKPTPNYENKRRAKENTE